MHSKPQRFQDTKPLWPGAGRILTGFALLGLLFLAWPGWLNGRLGDFTSPRRVTWKVEIDPSLLGTAQS